MLLSTTLNVKGRGRVEILDCCTSTFQLLYRWQLYNRSRLLLGRVSKNFRAVYIITVLLSKHMLRTKIVTQLIF